MAESLETPVQDDELSKTEIQLEQEKLRLERERILLEQERLATARERLESQAQMMRSTAGGKPAVSVSTTILISIICTLLGGILGAVSSSLHQNYQKNAKLQQVMDTLATVTPEEMESATNSVPAEGGAVPTWLKTMKPRGAHSGISLVVIQ
ncbi:MAG: hypothetical protein J6334_08845 [Kiritimatiellae bacterium]|nr:hypothetical protein [Kiritimatiellia bacterium]